ncbi:unnamed protein product, partial [Prorocentrum cordatum]
MSREELALEGCTEADVSAAQPLLRLLSTEQLFAIRAKLPASWEDRGPRRAHRGFVAAADALLLETLGRWALRGPPAGGEAGGDGAGEGGGEGGGGPGAAALLRSLGLRVVQVVGVVEARRRGWAVQERLARLGRGDAAHGWSAELPACWAFELAPGLWPDARAVVINAKELWAAPTAGRPEDFVALAAGAEIVVPVDKSAGAGKHCQLRWEMSVVDPSRHDVLTQLRLAGEPAEAPTVRWNDAPPDRSRCPPSPRAAEDEGSLGGALASEAAPRCHESGAAHHGGKYTGVLRPGGARCRARRRGGAASPCSSPEAVPTEAG